MAIGRQLNMVPELDAVEQWADQGVWLDQNCSLLDADDIAELRDWARQCRECSGESASFARFIEDMCNRAEAGGGKPYLPLHVWTLHDCTSGLVIASHTASRYNGHGINDVFTDAMIAIAHWLNITQIIGGWGDDPHTMKEWVKRMESE
jgi:hypothetical protein